MFKRLTALITISCLMAVITGAPAHASSYDFEVSVSGIVSQATVPTVITWHVNVASVGDAMGESAAQEGYVNFTAPASISLVLSDDCDTSGNSVSCYWLITDEEDAAFEIHGLVSLLALGAITITPTLANSSPRADSVSTNDAINYTCTAITALVVTCP